MDYSASQPSFTYIKEEIKEEEEVEEVQRSLTDVNTENFGTLCAVCAQPIMVPWVRCVQCKPQVDICTHCFTFGPEFGQHESDHPYTVINFTFPLFEASWTAAEELQLLEAIQEYGLGNWPAIGQRMRTKTDEECERHYMKCYVENPHPALPEFSDDITVDPGAPIIFKLSDNPPRPPEGSTLWAELGGYSAPRSDFNVEHDNYVEVEVCQLTNSDHEDDSDSDSESESTPSDRVLFKDLKLAVTDVYRNCLLERQRRKKIIRDYGLINMRLWYVYFRRRVENPGPLEALRPFMRLFPPITFDKYMESLIYEKQLKSDISRLQEYRRNGIKRLHSVKWYKLMKQRRESMKNQRSLLTGVLNHVKDELSCQAWLAKQATLSQGATKALTQSLPNLPRKAAPPLYIEDLPGYEKLNEAEKELCATVRLVPEAYLDFSKILIAECRKNGYLRLAQARPLIKIDVNKTRKLFDFLILHGHINKEPV